MRKIKWEKWKDILEHSDKEDNKKFVMHTPLGLVSHHIRKDAKDSLNFWIAHTNFDINIEAYNKIKNVPGVEILSLFTPYSFRIAIGKMFKEKAVMDAVSKALGCERIKSAAIDWKHKDLIVKAKKEVSQKKYWCIYVLPNGGFEYFSTDVAEEFVDPLSFYSGLKNSVGGLLLTSSNKIGV